MSRLERYTAEQRLKIPFKNEEWHKLAGRENRMKDQFNPERTVTIQEQDLQPDEVIQLKERGATFPIEAKTPEKTFLYTEEEDKVFPIETGQPLQATYDNGKDGDIHGSR